MSQQAATITSLPIAFEIVKAMQATGLDWGEGYRPLGRQALEEIIEGQMPRRSSAISTNSRPATLSAASSTELCACTAR
jgi:hypothetical protein